MGEAQTSGTLSFFKNSLSFFQEFLEFHEFLSISHCFHENYLPFLYGNHGFEAGNVWEDQVAVFILVDFL